MIHVNDLTMPPQIGEIYLVDCVKYKWRWIPIRGAWHEDRELLKFSEEHYHIDWRFILADEVRDDARFPKDGDVNAVVLHDHYDKMDGAFLKVGRTIKALKIMCVASERPWHFWKWNNKTTRVGTLFEQEYACATLKNMVCPHRGADLKSVPVIDGCITCPLHGLKWNAASGALVRQTV